jgi:hypothetical protein
VTVELRGRGIFRFGTGTQGGARTARWPWAKVLRPFGAETRSRCQFSVTPCVQRKDVGHDQPHGEVIGGEGLCHYILQSSVVRLDNAVSNAASVTVSARSVAISFRFGVTLPNQRCFLVTAHQ